MSRRKDDDRHTRDDLDLDAATRKYVAAMDRYAEVLREYARTRARYVESMWIHPARFDMDDDGPVERLHLVEAPDRDEVEW